MKESRLRFTKIKANKIIKENNKFFGRNYKKVKTSPKLYKLVEIRRKK